MTSDTPSWPAHGFYFLNSREFAMMAPIMQTNLINKGQIVEKPWGYEIIWAHTERYVGKILHINKGESLSYQYHVVKDETIRLLSGALEMDIETSGERGKLRLLPGESLHIIPRMKHRMIAIEDCDVLEVSTPELDDVVRLEDRYGRADSGSTK
jgi:mannose-6-phosphate isomerase